MRYKKDLFIDYEEKEVNEVEKEVGISQEEEEEVEEDKEVVEGIMEWLEEGKSSINDNNISILNSKNGKVNSNFKFNILKILNFIISYFLQKLLF